MLCWHLTKTSSSPSQNFSQLFRQISEENLNYKRIGICWNLHAVKLTRFRWVRVSYIYSFFCLIVQVTQIPKCLEFPRMVPFNLFCFQDSMPLILEKWHQPKWKSESYFQQGSPTTCFVFPDRMQAIGCILCSGGEKFCCLNLHFLPSDLSHRHWTPVLRFCQNASFIFSWFLYFQSYFSHFFICPCSNDSLYFLDILILYFFILGVFSVTFGGNFVWA